MKFGLRLWHGISNVLIYYSQNLQSMLKKVLKYIYISDLYDYGNFELYYGDDFYEILLSFYSSDLDHYYKTIPFNLLNDEEMKTLTILNENVFKIGSKELIQTLRDDIYKLFDHVFSNIIISLVLFFLGFGIYFFIFQIGDIYKKNQLINTTRRMLRIIPKHILYKLISGEK